MGMRFDTAEAATRKDFDRASKVPGGRLAYLSRFPEAIQWIEDPTLLEQLVAIGTVTLSCISDSKRLNVHAFTLIKVLHPDLVTWIARHTKIHIPNLDQYPEKIKQMAVEYYPDRIATLTDPSEKIMMICVTRYNASMALLEKFQPTDKVVMRAIRTRGEAIGYIKNPTMEMMELAVRKNSENLSLIDNPPDSIIRLAVRKSGMAIEYVKNPSEELQRLAVSKSAQAITVIDNPLPELQVQAVTKSPNIIRLIKNPCEEAMWVALGKKPKLIREMKYATPEMHGYAKMVA